MFLLRRGVCVLQEGQNHVRWVFSLLLASHVRAGKLVFEKKEIDVSHKRQCTVTTTTQNQSNEGSAVAAWQHRWEP